VIIAQAKPELRSRTYGRVLSDPRCDGGDERSLLACMALSIGPRANFVGAAICGAPRTIWFWRFVYRRPQTQKVDGRKQDRQTARAGHDHGEQNTIFRILLVRSSSLRC